MSKLLPIRASRCRDVSSEPDPEAAASRSLRQELRTPIDSTGFPVRATIWRIRGERYLFCLNVHHLASDAWSGFLQIRDLEALYEAGDAEQRLPLVSAQYADFTLDQEHTSKADDSWRMQPTGARNSPTPYTIPSRLRQGPRRESGKLSAPTPS